MQTPLIQPFEMTQRSENFVLNNIFRTWGFFRTSIFLKCTVLHKLILFLTIIEHSTSLEWQYFYLQELHNIYTGGNFVWVISLYNKMTYRS